MHVPGGLGHPRAPDGPVRAAVAAHVVLRGAVPLLRPRHDPAVGRDDGGGLRGGGVHLRLPAVLRRRLAARAVVLPVGAGDDADAGAHAGRGLGVELDGGLCCCQDHAHLFW